MGQDAQSAQMAPIPQKKRQPSAIPARPIQSPLKIGLHVRVCRVSTQMKERSALWSFPTGTARVPLANPSPHPPPQLSSWSPKGVMSQYLARKSAHEPPYHFLFCPEGFYAFRLGYAEKCPGDSKACLGTSCIGLEGCNSDLQCEQGYRGVLCGTGSTFKHPKRPPSVGGEGRVCMYEY